MTKTQQRAEAIQRAQAAFDRLTADPDVGRAQLGHARDHLRRVRTVGDLDQALDDVHTLENLAQVSAATDSHEQER